VRRGFKTDAERIGAELRRELGLHVKEKLAPLELAAHLAIPVFTILQVSKVVPDSTFYEYFSGIDQDSFSAVTIFCGSKRFIVHNEHHHPNRQSSNLTHEISHTILEHEPTPVINANGHRYWNGDVEDEATWLGAALLVPREGALIMLKADWLVSEIAEHFGVSESLCRWRITQCGIDRQVERWRRYR